MSKSRALRNVNSIPPATQVLEEVLHNGVRTTCHYAKVLHSTIEPALSNEDGDAYWFYMGKLHREGGPAMRQKGDLFWYRHGLLHREGGPAIVRKDGREEFFENGVRI